MPAVVSIRVWQPHSGRLQDFTARVARAKRIHERLRGKVRVFNSHFGGVPLSVCYIIEHPDWKAFGEFRATVEADAEWLALVAENTRDPTADLISSQVLVEVPVG
jgi:NIPSNAP protein